MWFDIDTTSKAWISNTMALPVLPWLFLLLLLSFCESALAQQSAATGKVVILFDTNSLTPWKGVFSTSVAERFAEAQNDFARMRFTFEFLGLKDYPRGVRPDAVIDMLRYKQRADPASIVISSSTLALTPDFLQNYGDEIYPSVPRVYVSPLGGVQEVAILPSIDSNRTLLIGARDVLEKTLAVIPKLLPGTQQLFVISGGSEIDLAFVAEARPYLNEMSSIMDVIYLTALPADELYGLAADFPDNSAILLVSYELRQDGLGSGPVNFVPKLVAAGNTPIFTAFNSLFQEGVVGGNFTSADLSGRRTAELAMALLGGQNISANLPPETNYIFDRNQLDRWDIDDGLLPLDSVILNQQFSFIDLYTQQLQAIFAVFILLLGFVIFLRRQAKNLGTQKILFESVINSIPDAIFITDVNKRTLATNKGAEEIFGFSQDEMLGRPPHELTQHVDSVDAESGKVVSALQNTIEPKVLEYRKKNGQKFFGETIATQITSDSGEMLGHFALIRDISKRLSLEEEQRQGQKMEALGNLVGGISHDFNNVLAVISGYAELSLVTTDMKSLEGNQNQILKATNRAKSLISQIMSFSRDTTIKQKPTDLTALLDETMKLLKASIPSRIEITVTIDESLRPVMGSEVQIQQILMNLATNAYQAMELTGGTLTIALERELVSTELMLSHGVLTPGNYSVLSVTDNGPGMSREVASRVFEPFFTTKKRGEGSGMGMAIVYRLVKTHRATMDMQTLPGIGTRIMVYFEELGNVESENVEERESLPLKGRGERILLVDDEEGLLDSTQQLLTNIGYQVEAFSDPKEALKAFRHQPKDFDLLVTDENMPKISGVQLVKAIRKLAPCFPAIICTGYSEVLNQVDVDHLELSAVVRKPFTLEEISKIIGESLNLKNKA